jgi:hypothetical protein
MPTSRFRGRVRTPAPHLADGQKVYVEDFTSSKGKTFAATVHFGTEAGRPGKRIIPEFG